MRVTCRIENGDKVWRNEEGQVSRKNGPAIEKNNGDKYWCKNGKLHRLAGPAVEYKNGTKEWWFRGDVIICKSQEEFVDLISINLTIKGNKYKLIPVD